MSKGGKTSSDTYTTSNNTSGSSAIDGDNLGVVLAGINGSEINIMPTDYGAVESASSIASHALDTNLEAIRTSTSLGTDALKFGEKSINSAFEFGDDAMTTSANLSRDALKMGKESLSDAFDFGRESQAGINQTAQIAIKENKTLSESAMSNVLKNSESTTSAIKSMAAQSGESARAALTMAENTISKSQIGSDGEMSKVAIAVAVVLGISFVAVAFKGGH